MFIQVDEEDMTNDWLKRYDQRRGKVYYYSPSRRKSVWKLPTESTNQKQLENRPKSRGQSSSISLDFDGRKASRSLSSGEAGHESFSLVRDGNWISVVDKKTQRTYWYNRATRETSWEKPNQ